MGTPFKRTSRTGPTGVRTTLTHKQTGGSKRTTSQRTGTSTRVAATTSSNGSVVRTTTQKLGNGYIKRSSTTTVKPVKMTFVKPNKPPKPPKPPKASKRPKAPKRPKATMRPKAPKRSVRRRSRKNRSGWWIYLVIAAFIFGIWFG